MDSHLPRQNPEFLFISQTPKLKIRCFELTSDGTSLLMHSRIRPVLSMSASIQPTSFPQFPSGDAVITVPAAVDGSGAYMYPKAEIGWSLRQDNMTTTSRGKTISKHCLGALRCMDGECIRYKVDIRPKTTSDGRSKQENDGCGQCKKRLAHISCSYVARVVYVGDVCRLEPGKKPGQDRHTHGQYMAIHLSADQEQELGTCIEANPGATPKDLILGMSSAIGTTFPSVRNINPMLQNIDRLGYHVRKEKKKAVTEKNESGIEVRTAIQELYQVQEDFSDMFVSFDLTKGNTVIGFRPPAIAGVINLQAYPMIMDATFTVFQKGFYLCTTVVYCQEIQKYATIFSAVIDGLSQRNFKAYFMRLFDVYDITFDGRRDILGIIMDFSDAQRGGFIQAYHEITARDDGIKYVKGCRVHFKRNVFKMAEAYKQQHGGEKTRKKEISKLATSLTLAKTEDEYNAILSNLAEKFHIAKSWIKWWNRNDVRTTIFPAVSAMKQDLQDHPTTDTNAVESFHNEVYRRMKKRSTSLVTNLRRTLQLIQHDDFAMDNYLQGSSYYYGKQPKKSKKKAKRKHVGDPDHRTSKKRKVKAAKYVNDGDAPCTVDAMKRANKKIDAGAKRDARLSKKKRLSKKSKKKKKHYKSSKSQRKHAHGKYEGK